MTYIAFQLYLFLLLCFARQIILVCQGPYPNLCSYNENDNETNSEDDDRSICDCQKVTFCFIIELSQECNLTVIKLNTEANNTLSNYFHCEISSLEAQARIPTLDFSPQNGDEILVRIFTDSDFGKYKVDCKMSEVSDKFNGTFYRKWEILNVSPMAVLIDSEVELHLTVISQAETSLFSSWCFVKTPDNNTEILLASWLSDNLVNCLGFHPVVPGVFTVSLSSIMPPNNLEKTQSVIVLSKHPVVQKVKYSLDFGSIFLFFDENIELHSSCNSVFSKLSVEHLGVGFKCYVRGNILEVKRGSHFKTFDYVAINPENKICRAGTYDSEFCISTSPSILPISKPKISAPVLSWYVNYACKSNSTQKYMNIKVSPKLRANFANHIKTFQFKDFGKTQRKNIINWRLLRQFQSKLSARQIVLQMDETQVSSLLENASSLETILDFNVDVASAVKVSVTVQPSPAFSITAEAEVKFCKNSAQLFRYKWFINKKDISEDGRLVIIKNLTPGKYLIKCMVIAYNSTEILGEGWSTAEVFASEEKVFISPSEVTIGAADNILLKAVTLHGNSVFWTCRTAFGEPCFTSNQKLVSDMFDLNSFSISIPGYTLPAGDYIWTAESIQGSNEAKVFISPRNLSAISVKIPSVFVKPSEGIILFGTVKKLEGDCRAWWSSVRQKGFSYYKLSTAESQKNTIRIQYSAEEVLLMILSPENLKELEFDSFFMFKFQAFCPQRSKNEKGSLAYVTVPLIIRNPPRVSPLVVEPLEGKAMITKFEISGADVGVSSENHSFLYEWSYIDTCGVAVPIKRVAFSKNFTTYLPPGDLKVIVKVCDEREICTTASSPTISVIQAFEFPAENFRDANNEIQYLMASSDTLEAFGLTVTVFKSLALLAEPEVRKEIFSTVEEAIIIKINDLTEKMSSDSNAAKSSLEFFERAVKVAKYFPKGSEIMKLLTEFKNSILKGKK